MATKVAGLDRLKRKLTELPVAARAAIAKALEEAAQQMVGLAKRLVPVDSGDLRGSIGWTWGAAPKGSIKLGEVKWSRRAGNLRITIYAGDDEAFYARWVEFGTAQNLAQPYFYPSYRTLKKGMRSRVSRAINKAAKQVAAQ